MACKRDVNFTSVCLDLTELADNPSVAFVHVCNLRRCLSRAHARSACEPGEPNVTAVKKQRAK